MDRASRVYLRRGLLVGCMAAGVVALVVGIADYAWTVDAIDGADYAHDRDVARAYALRSWGYLALVVTGIGASVPLLDAPAERHNGYGMAAGIAAVTAAVLTFSNYLVFYYGDSNRPFPLLQIWLIVGALLVAATRVKKAAPSGPAPVPTEPAEQPSAPEASEQAEMSTGGRILVGVSAGVSLVAVLLGLVLMSSECGAADPVVGVLFPMSGLLAVFGIGCLVARRWIAALPPIVLAVPCMFISAVSATCETLSGVVG